MAQLKQSLFPRKTGCLVHLHCRSIDNNTNSSSNSLPHQITPELCSTDVLIYQNNCLGSARLTAIFEARGKQYRIFSLPWPHSVDIAQPQSADL